MMCSLNTNLCTVTIYCFVLLCTSLKCDAYFLLALLIYLMQLDFKTGKPKGWESFYICPNKSLCSFVNEKTLTAFSRVVQMKVLNWRITTNFWEVFKLRVRTIGHQQELSWQSCLNPLARMKPRNVHSEICGEFLDAVFVPFQWNQNVCPYLPKN